MMFSCRSGDDAGGGATWGSLPGSHWWRGDDVPRWLIVPARRCEMDPVAVGGCGAR